MTTTYLFENTILSAKYSYLAWQVNTSSPAEKLVLLMLADGADEFGFTNVCLQSASQLCALSTFGLADCLKCLVDQGFLDKVKVDYRDKKEIHVFKMLIEQEQAAVQVETQPVNSIPVYSTAPAPAP
ncbi:hypothetical protein AB4069_15025, partial [Vibrio cyclitrophicus]